MGDGASLNVLMILKFGGISVLAGKAYRLGNWGKGYGRIFDTSILAKSKCDGWMYCVFDKMVTFIYTNGNRRYTICI